MKRFLLALACCSSLVFLSPISYSVDLKGPDGEQPLLSDKYGPITSVETLWSISTKLRPNSSVSVQQTIVAIYKLNPYAFYRGNINKLIPESVITVPSLEFIKRQSNQEALALINKYSPRRKTERVKYVARAVAPVKAQVKPPRPTPAAPVPTAPSAAANLLAKNELLAAENKLGALQSELNLVNEQLLVSTEASQSLKLKLQPLKDEISALQEQIDSELVINAKLQAIIDDYRAQLDAVEALPFSGDGWLDTILRLITSSLTNLLITIISPILLLLAVFVMILRIRSKQSLAEQEKELAESTAILMEQTGQFDVLLTDDFSGEAEEELDFSDDFDTSAVNINSSQDDAIDIDEIESIDLTDAEDDAFDVVDLTEADEYETSEDDPFGIGALTAREDLISNVDFNDLETELSEDDPFGIGALVAGDDFAAELAADTPVISAAEQADLDLAAQWEAQLADDAQGKANDVVEQESAENVPATAEEIDDLISVSAQAVLESPLSTAYELPVDLDTQESETELPESEVADIEQISAADLEISDEEDPLAFDLTESNDQQSDVLELDESLLFDASALDDLIELQAKTQAKEEDTDLFAQQLSEVAFNAQVPLPKVDSQQKNSFISIESLLEESDEHAKNEPYAELDFDLDLNDFPDVINSKGLVDIDDDENGIGAQLDLARAYLEIDDKPGAKEILLSLVDLSNGAQRVEIDKLLSRLK